MKVRSVYVPTTDEGDIAEFTQMQLADDGLIQAGQTVEVIDYANIGWMGEAYEVEYVTVEVRG